MQPHHLYQNQMQHMHASSRDKTKIAGVLVYAIIILASSIGGLIMDANDVPWIAEKETEWDDDYIEKTVTYNESSWEECCEEVYDEYENGDEEEQRYARTFSTLFQPMTTLFVLAICFSSVMIIIAVVPMPRFVKEPILSLLGLSIMTTGTFLMRKFALWLSLYFSRLLNLSPDQDVSFHLHVMVYFGGFVGLICIFTGFYTISKLGKYITWEDLKFNKLRRYSTMLLMISLAAFLLSPLIPLSYAEYDQDWEYYDEEDDPEGEYILPITVLMLDDDIQAEMEYDGDDREEYEQILPVTENYTLVDNLYLILMWISLGCLALISLAVIPKVGPVFEGIAQVNILTIGLIVPIIIFTIMLYIGIPDLYGDDSIYSESRYNGVNFHSNWILPLCGILSAIVWIFILVKSHIPWWVRTVGGQGGQDPIQQISQQMYQQPIQQPVQQNNYGNWENQPPQY